VVTFEEFFVAMKRLGLDVAEEQVRTLFDEFDPDGSGEVPSPSSAPSPAPVPSPSPSPSP